MYMRISWKGQKRNPHSSGDYADTNRTDGSSRNFAGFGFLDFISGWLGKLMAATGFPTELIPVAVIKCFFLCSNGTLLDIYKHMVQIRCWDVRHRLCSAAQRPFLYHVGLFYVGKSKRQDIHFREPFCNHCRNCGKCISCVET